MNNFQLSALRLMPSICEVISSGRFTVISYERLKVSIPEELWSFHTRLAILETALRCEELALKHGLTLDDPHPENFMVLGRYGLLVDLGAFNDWGSELHWAVVDEIWRARRAFENFLVLPILVSMANDFEPTTSGDWFRNSRGRRETFALLSRSARGLICFSLLQFSVFLIDGFLKLRTKFVRSDLTSSHKKMLSRPYKWLLSYATKQLALALSRRGVPAVDSAEEVDNTASETLPNIVFSRRWPNPFQHQSKAEGVCLFLSPDPLLVCEIQQSCSDNSFHGVAALRQALPIIADTISQFNEKGESPEILVEVDMTIDVVGQAVSLGEFAKIIAKGRARWSLVFDVQNRGLAKEDDRHFGQTDLDKMVELLTLSGAATSKVSCLRRHDSNRYWFDVSTLQEKS